MSLDDIVNVTIDKETRYPSQKGFGTPIIVASHSYWLDRVRLFAELTELTDAGVAVTHPIYKMAQAMLSQPRRPRNFAVGRRGLRPVQTFQFTIKDATEGTIYTFDIVSDAGVKSTITYTVLAAATTTTVATAIAALIDAHADIVAAGAAAVITATTGTGKVVGYENLPKISQMGVTETTPDPGIATDLAAIESATVNSGGTLSWYGMCFDVLGEATIAAIATFVEARKLVSCVRSSDSGIADGVVTTDVASDLKAGGFARTWGLFAQRATNDYRDAAWLANTLSYEPGEATPAFKLLPGILVDRLSSGEENAVKAKFWSVYVTTNNINYTYQGKTGAGDFIDLTIGVDWLHARLQEEIFGLKASAKKIPYTQKGIDAVVASGQKVLNRATVAPNTILSPDFPPVMRGPSIANVPTADKSTRTLNNVTFEGVFTGAIHNTNIRGTVAL